jgi:nucleotide-binding universal stress UspA family protein
MSDGPDSQHHIPPGVDQATVDALGKLSEALEVVEDARGRLYSFHRLTGTADLALGEAVDMLRSAGHAELADRINSEVLGRNVISGRWTFQIVEDYDANYYSAFKALEKEARDALVQGRTHLYEAQMKEQRRTHGKPHHEALPEDVASSGSRT